MAARERRRLQESGNDGGGNSTEDARPPPALAETLDKLQQDLTRNRLNGDAIVRLVDVVSQHSLEHGFTAAEATRVVRIALRSGRGTQPLASRQAMNLMRCIRPAINELVGDAFILIIVGSLGGVSASAMGEQRRRRWRKVQDDDSSGEESSYYPDDETGDDDDGDDDSTELAVSVRKHGRKAIDIRTQAKALRLIVNMLAPPAVISLDVQGIRDGDQAEAGTGKASLPSTFLNNAARRALDRCYGILFHFLDYEFLRPELCHILCHITRRKHVRHHRIVKVLALRSKLPSDIYVSALLNTYAAFYPDMLFSESTTTQQQLSQSPDQVHGLSYPGSRWLLEVSNLWRHGHVIHPDEQGHMPLVRARARRKRNKAVSLASLLPTPSVLITHDTTLVISEIVSFRELGYRMDTVQMPDQLACGLANRATMVALLSAHVGRQMSRNFARVHQWATGAISDCMRLPLLIAQGTLPLERSDAAHDNSAALMNAVRRFARRVGGCDERLQNRLSRVLHVDIWKQLQAHEKRAFLGLLEYLLPTRLNTFEEEVLRPLLEIASHADDDETSRILCAIGNMLSNWAAQDWMSIYGRLQAGKKDVYWGAQPLSKAVAYNDTIAHTIARTTSAAAELLARRPNSIAVLHACLSLLEAVFVEEFVGLHDLLLPPSFLLYIAGFTPYGAAMSLSRQMGLVHNVRRMHQRYLSAKADGEASDTTALDGRPIPLALQERRSNFFAEAGSDLINDCVILLVDLIWRNNGFASVEDGNANIGLPIDFFYALSSRCQGRGDELQRIGSASHSASLGVLMEAYANDLARNCGATRPVLHGPLTPSMLKVARREKFPIMSHRDFRDSFLTWLAQHGARGVSDLLSATITRFIRGSQEAEQSTMLA